MKADILVDSDVLIGFFYDKDAHNQRANALFHELYLQKKNVVVNNYVINEVATILSHRQGQYEAKFFLTQMQKLSIPTLFISQDVQNKAEKLFSTQTKKGTSMTDCANVVVMKEYGIPQILTFDKAYAKQYNVSVMS